MTFCREIPPFRFLAWFNIMHHIIQFFNKEHLKAEHLYRLAFDNSARNLGVVSWMEDGISVNRHCIILLRAF